MIRPLTLQFIVLFSLLFFTSCETEVELDADWKEITVVYGLINQLDTEHYLRINKAFLGGNALKIAKIEDSSSYFNDLDVRVEGWGPNGPLYAISFDTISIFNKDSGLWYNPYMVVYKGVGQLIPDLHYQLVVRNIRTGHEIRGKTNLIRNFDIIKPVSGGRQNFTRGSSTAIEWENALNAWRYEPVVRFHYAEIPAGSQDTSHKFIDYNLSAVDPKNYDGVGMSESLLSNDGFYEHLRRKLNNNFEGRRLCERVTFIIYAGGEEYQTYMRVNAPSNSIVMDRPEYTNIENGLGLFSSSYSVTRTKRLDPRAEVEIIEMNIKFVKNPQL